MDEVIVSDDFVHLPWLRQILELNSKIAIIGSYVQHRFIKWINYKDIDLIIPVEFHPQIYQIFQDNNLHIRSDFRIGNNHYLTFFELDPLTGKNIELDIIPGDISMVFNFAFPSRLYIQGGNKLFISPLARECLEKRTIPIPQIGFSTADISYCKKQILKGFILSETETIQ